LNYKPFFFFEIQNLEKFLLLYLKKKKKKNMLL